MASPHRNTSLYLTFSSNFPPYAEAAAHAISSSLLPLRLGLGQETILTIPPQLLKNARSEVVKGKHSVSRFMMRLKEESIYSGEETIEKIRAASKADQLTALITAPSKPFSLVDLLLWDKLKTMKVSTTEATDFIAQIESSEQIKAVLVQIEYTLSTYSVTGMFRLAVVKALALQLKMTEAFIENALTTPLSLTNGNYALPVPKLRLPGNPVQIAQELSAAYKTCNLITKCTSTGPFINFFINDNEMRDRIIPQIITLDEAYGDNASGFGQLAVVEYSSPNIAKPFHAGHLRSTIIGNFVKNVLNRNGWKTVSINYLGDWGKQYGLLALGFLKYGSRDELTKDPIRHLFDVYVKINVDAKADENVDAEAKLYFKRMEDGDEETLALWKEFRDLSIVKYKEIFHRINCEFDIYSGESQYSLAQMGDVIKELEEHNLLVRENGARVVHLQELTTAIIEKSDGSMLYLSRDIAAAIDRQSEFSFDKMYYIVGGQQDHHFKQLFKILTLMGKPWAQNLVHLNFGLIKSKTGNMSTRNGSVVFLEDILNATKEEMHTAMKTNENKYAQISDPEFVSDLVGISSIVVQDMFARRHKDYEFDWSRMMSFEGDTGPYLQYAHARLCSIYRKYGKEIDLSKTDLTLLVEPEAAAVVECIAQFPLVVRDCMGAFEPNTVVVYAFVLCHRVSCAIETLWVQGKEDDLAAARVALYLAARITLGNVLKLIGLRPLERM